MDKEIRDYEAEFDTNPGFNSPALHKLTSIKTNESIISWNITVPKKDSTVYYWRARVLDADSSKAVWESSSFIYISNSHSGWSQSHFPQFKKDEYNNMIQHRKCFSFQNSHVS
jgi:uncharacterized GH25 family protein